MQAQARQFKASKAVTRGKALMIKEDLGFSLYKSYHKSCQHNTQQD